MKMARILSIITRHAFISIRDLNKLLSLVYWPAIDIFIWGFNSVWINNQVLEENKISLIMLTAVALWIIVYTISQSISKSILEEIWSQNLVNLFSTPLKISEWIIGIMTVSILDLSISFSVSLLITKLLYGINILKIGIPIIYFIFLLLVSGWILGFLAAGFLIYFGQRVESLPWMVGWIFVPFSSVFFPISVLPTWGQNIALFLPMSYAFETMRKFVLTDFIDIKMILTSLFLNALYLVLSILFFIFMFNKSKKLGLARLE